MAVLESAPSRRGLTRATSCLSWRAPRWAS